MIIVMIVNVVFAVIFFHYSDSKKKEYLKIKNFWVSNFEIDVFSSSTF